jgi:diguanylate cyclase (GGDEF)-like protein/PAS domain S-box-containing protein
MSAWHGLLANLGIVCLIVAVWTYLDTWTGRQSRSMRVLIESVLAGLGVVAVMSFPFTIMPGVVADLRTAIIVLSGFVAGPVAGLVAGAVATLYRLIAGGSGATAGIVGIGVATTVGIVGHRLLGGRLPRERDVLLLAAAATGPSMVAFLFLPEPLRAAAGFGMAAPVATLAFIATAVGGFTVAAHLRQREIATTNMIYRAIIDALPDPLNAKDLDGRFLAANPATASLMKAGAAQNLVGRSDFDFYPGDTARRFRDDKEAVLARGEPATIEQRIDRDGSTIWLSTLKVPLRDRAGAVIGLLTHNRDITSRKRLEEAHAEAQERLAAALANMADALVMFDRDERLVLCNEQYRAIFAKTADLRVPGTPLSTILRASIERHEEVGIPPEEVDDWIRRTCAALHVASEHEITLADGRRLRARVRPAADGASLSVISDVTAEREAERALSILNERLAAMARTDALTGLVNRRGFDEALAAEIARVRRAGTSVGLLLVDVDRFKAYNDTYGHPAGDACLKAVADCLKATLRRPGDVAARYGGEEFAAILPETTAAGVLHIAETLREAVAALAMEHKATDEGLVTVSAGVSTVTAEEAELDGAALLIQRADRALYHAKAGGRNRVRGEWPVPGRIGETAA